MSDVTGSLVKSALDYHAATNPQSRFPVCRCGHSSMDVYRPRHLHEMVERLTGAVLMPTPLIGAPSASLMDLLTAAMVAASEQQRADLLPYTVVARSYVSAYAAYDDTPMLSRENIVGVLESSLDAHSVAEMTMSPEGGIVMRCGCGLEVDSDLFENHRAAEAAKVGCVYSTVDELVATYRALGTLTKEIPAELVRGFGMETHTHLAHLSRLKSAIERTRRAG